MALGILLFALAASSVLAAHYLDAFDRSRELRDVKELMGESMAGLESVAANDWASLAAGGSYGLSSAGGSWQTVPTSDVVGGKYTRSLAIEAVYRDDVDCLVTDTLGTLDPDTKKATLFLDWQERGRSYSRQIARYVTNWKAPTPMCQVIEQAGSLEIDVAGANLDSTKKQMEGVVFRNLGTTDITIDLIRLTWEKVDGSSPGTSKSIKIRGADVWHSSGVGSPSGDQPSGTEVDIVDVVILAGETAIVDRFRFNDKLDGCKFWIKATMGDASATEVETDDFLP